MVSITTTLLVGLNILLSNVAGAPNDVQVKRAGEITHTGISFFGPAGLGACGFVDTDNDLIVGISTLIFGTGGNCNQFMQVTNIANGKSVIVRTRDSCTGCGRDDIVLSRSAFASIGDINLGELNVQWHFEAKDFTPTSSIPASTQGPSSSSSRAGVTTPPSSSSSEVIFPPRALQTTTPCCD
ncbi:hypothetical protein NLI96_g8068 [Meripilus lineatus]|uniref:RlpA-like protein double-psi beta-barrel domain-containing protein n=1 Tax=Meripilus lineatus TaxID=2056292 RepID=A0AAD5UY04_9APHY|nr:hypothetical protein NLI96_g8068 [Physisporinus lineatus]